MEEDYFYSSRTLIFGSTWPKKYKHTWHVKKTADFKVESESGEGRDENERHKELVDDKELWRKNSWIVTEYGV